jgi:hypothetical protein
MGKKSRYIVSLLLLFVFSLHAVVKLEHHHKDFPSDLKTEKHFPVLRENCSICNFEFSIFIPAIKDPELIKDDSSDRYFNSYISHNYSSFSNFPFSLRGPPYKQI